ncbi:hypothetical protein AB0N73_03505 [Microbacterium sp. NPDC089189]|uniref:hypothetical protein n=1 Tax=Microbacterium sp. NPDC089189 TaxID=3154972 RepID=UPI00342213C9
MSIPGAASSTGYRVLAGVVSVVGFVVVIAVLAAAIGALVVSAALIATHTW